MVLIISSESDSSTTLVIDWLIKAGVEFLRISARNKVEVHYMDIDNFELSEISIDEKLFMIKDFKSIWYRRSKLFLKQAEKFHCAEKKIETAINEQLQDENDVFNAYFLAKLKDYSINSQIDNKLNKLEVLEKCIAIGIKIPATVICRSKKQVASFKNRYKNIITKNATPGMFLQNDDVKMGSGTILVTENLISNLPDKFYPMMFQEMVDKSFELRIFYLKGKLYASAIFSQNDEKTKVDFRNYNFEKPNRTPPFKLPKEYASKIDRLMNTLKINSGSIDLLVSKFGEIIFLEVNPVGQFYQVSHPCNYNLEKEMAKSLYL